MHYTKGPLAVVVYQRKNLQESHVNDYSVAAKLLSNSSPCQAQSRKTEASAAAERQGKFLENPQVLGLVPGKCYLIH
jgi:hypothetical protein